MKESTTSSLDFTDCNLLIEVTFFKYRTKSSDLDSICFSLSLNALPFVVTLVGREAQCSFPNGDSLFFFFHFVLSVWPCLSEHCVVTALACLFSSYTWERITYHLPSLTCLLSFDSSIIQTPAKTTLVLSTLSFLEKHRCIRFLFLFHYCTLVATGTNCDQPESANCESKLCYF